MRTIPTWWRESLVALQEAAPPLTMMYELRLLESDGLSLCFANALNRVNDATGCQRRSTARTEAQAFPRSCHLGCCSATGAAPTCCLPPTEVARILLVDDDLDLVDLTAYSLRKEGHEVTIFSEGQTALRSLRGHQPDLVLLDVRLPGTSGVTVCREMREHSSVPIIMVSGTSDEEPIISSFAAGADDFVIKPYSHRQLAARIHALLGRGSLRSEAEPRRELRFGQMELDPESHELRRADGTVLLTPIECRLLQMLVLNRGHVVTSERLIEFAWRYEGADSRSLRTHVSHLRHKMRVTKGQLGYITAISRVGYSLSTQ